MRWAHDRRRGSIVGALLLFAGCGRSDLLPGLAGSGTGGTAGTSGTLGAGEANGTGGDRATGGSAGSGATVGTGGSSGGGGNTGTSAASGGATEPCSTIAELPADAKPICTYTGDYANLQEVSNCLNAHVTIYSDGTHYYFAPTSDQLVVQCPSGAIGSGILDPDVTRGAGRSLGLKDVLLWNMMENGLSGLTCDVTDEFGPGYSHNYVCSPNGVQILLPNPKSDVVYVLFPDPGSGHGSAGYVGVFNYFACSYSGPLYTNIWFYPRTADFLHDGTAALGTQPIACSADNSTYTFNDLDGQRLSITFGVYMNIIRVQP